MKKIGIIGGGQLGKMMILDGKRLDTQFSILDPTEHCPAHSIADRHIVADFDDVDAIIRLAEDVDVVTYEFEHISVQPVIKFTPAQRLWRTFRINWCRRDGCVSTIFLYRISWRLLLWRIFTRRRVSSPTR